MRGPLQRPVVSYLRKISKNVPIARAGGSLFAGFDSGRCARELSDDGYSMGFSLPVELIDEIRQFHAGANSDNILNPHKECRALDAIAHDPGVVDVARRYFGVEPVLYATRLYYASPRTRAEIEEVYANERKVHFDVTDFMDLALFIYLTDIDEDTSPHIVVRGTHKRKTIMDLINQRYTVKTALERFPDRFRAVIGPAGMAFFEDTSVFHIQGLGTRGRLMAVCGYTMHRSPYLSRYAVP